MTQKKLSLQMWCKALLRQPFLMELTYELNLVAISMFILVIGKYKYKRNK